MHRATAFLRLGGVEAGAGCPCSLRKRQVARGCRCQELHICFTRLVRQLRARFHRLAVAAY